jgi:hypothetical protein
LKVFDESGPQLDCPFHGGGQPLKLQGGFAEVAPISELQHGVSLRLQLFVKGTNVLFDLFSGAQNPDLNQLFQYTAELTGYIFIFSAGMDATGRREAAADRQLARAGCRSSPDRVRARRCYRVLLLSSRT